MATSTLLLNSKLSADEVYSRLLTIFDGGKLFLGYLDPRPKEYPVKQGSQIDAIGEIPPMHRNVDIQGQIIEMQDYVLSFYFKDFAFYDKNMMPRYKRNKRTTITFRVEDNSKFDSSLDVYVKFSTGFFSRIKTDDVMSKLIWFLQNELDIN